MQANVIYSRVKVLKNENNQDDQEIFIDAWLHGFVNANHF